MSFWSLKGIGALTLLVVIVISVRFKFEFIGTYVRFTLELVFAFILARLRFNVALNSSLETFFMVSFKNTKK